MTNIIPKEISKLNPEYKEQEIVNLAQSMGGPYEMYLGLQKHQNLLADLEYVYIGIDPHILGEKFYHYMHVEKQFMTFKQWQYLFENHKKYMDKYHPNIVLDKFSPLRFFMSMFIKGCKKNSLFGGYEARFHHGVKEYKEEDIASYTYEPLALFPVSKFSLSYLQKIQNLLKKESQAKIVYFLSPSFNWQIGYEKYCKDYDLDLIRSLQDSLGDCEIIGSLYKEDFNLKKYDFYDNRHLSHTGALKYTNTLFQVIQKEEKKSKIVPLYRYRATPLEAYSFDSLNKNMNNLKKLLEKYLQNKEKIILYGFTNLSRCVMSLMGDTINRSKICDASSYLRTAPEFLFDDFIVKKGMIPLSDLHQEEYDALVICDFLKEDTRRDELEKKTLVNREIFSIEDETFDKSYFHMQVNMLLSLVKYISKSFEVVYIVGESTLLSFVSDLLLKSTLIKYISYEEILESESLDDSTQVAYIINEDKKLENYLIQNHSIDFENIIVMQF